jgi:long-chain acyl-CoA synthetase
MNLYDTFKNTAALYPENPAVVEGESAVSYQVLDGVISKIAVDLKVLGVVPGLMIGLCFPNSIACIALTYALWKLDAAVVPIDIELKQDEVELVCEQMKVVAMIHHNASDFISISGKCPVVDTPYYYRQGYLNTHSKKDTHIAFVRFTSGTTGDRKGVVLSHERILERIRSVNQALKITHDDNVLWILPMSHHFVSTIVLYLTMGATIVLAKGVWSNSILNIINSNDITLLYAAPFHYSLLAADSSGQMMPKVRLAISTTIGLPEDIHELFFYRFRLPIVQAYGIIEIGIVCINTDNPVGKPGSVGRVIKDYQIQIKNTKAYRGHSDIQFGELFFSGPGFFDAYFHPWIDEKTALVNGWFETGDIGGLDEDGYLYLHGRKNHVINTAGKKVFPGEIEAVINRHPAVKESCVYGKKQERFGQIVAAKVVLKRTGFQVDEGALKTFCSKKLAKYKVPEQIDFTDRLEKTISTGKILRP